MHVKPDRHSSFTNSLQPSLIIFVYGIGLPFSQTYPLSLETLTKILNNSTLYQFLNEEKLFFPIDLYVSFNHSSKNFSPNLFSNYFYEFISSMYNEDNKKNSISQTLQKQINYTLDTIINNMDNFEESVISSVSYKTTIMLIDMINQTDKDNVIHITALKLLHKLFNKYFKLKLKERLPALFTSHRRYNQRMQGR